MEKQHARLVTAWGETKYLAAWQRDPRCQVSLQVLHARLTHGWPAERALTTPARPQPTPRRLTAFGETKTLQEWVADLRCVVKYKVLVNRVEHHWPARDALTIPIGSTRSHQVVAFGETKRLSEWLHDARCCVSYQALAARLADGWDPETALTTPSRGKIPPHLITAFGETHSMADWSRDPRCGVPYHVLKKRLRRGWSPEAALTTPLGASRSVDGEPLHVRPSSVD